MSIHTDEQRLAVGNMVSLYTIDATAIGGALQRLTPGPLDGAVIMYQTNAYRPVPIEVKGIRMGGKGATARPSLSISRLDEPVLATLVGTDNLRGATISRLRTLEQYLDGQPGADPNRHWPVDKWRIERLLEQGSTELVWQLATPFDFDKKMLPGRQVLRDVCSWEYRIWDAAAAAFDYTNATCPYTGADYYTNRDAVAAAAADDRCSRKLSGCRLRFPDQPIPYGGFLGVGRVKD